MAVGDGVGGGLVGVGFPRVGGIITIGVGDGVGAVGVGVGVGRLWNGYSPTMLIFKPNLKITQPQ